MCGICFVLYGKAKDSDCKDVAVTEVQTAPDKLLHHRGPDSSHSYEFSPSPSAQGCMSGYVLHLRGKLTPQPLLNESEDALLWNGEIFGGIPVAVEENDTQVLFDLLSKCTSDSEVLTTLQTVRGPWAVMFWQASQQTLWFGRDIYGRRSLLWHLPKSPQEEFIISSVAFGDKTFSEIPSVGVFSLKFPSSSSDEATTPSSTPSPVLTLYPWKSCVWPGTSALVAETPAVQFPDLLFSYAPCSIPALIDHSEILTHWIPDMNLDIPDPIVVQKTGELTLSEEDSTEMQGSRKKWNCSTRHSDVDKDQDGLERLLRDRLKSDDCLDALSDDLIKVLQDAVMSRVNSVPRQQGILQDSEKTAESSLARVAILFSGGLDSTVLAALADRCLPKDEPIDLLNVAFEQNKKSIPPTKRQKKTKAQRMSHQKQALHTKDDDKIPDKTDSYEIKQAEDVSLNGSLCSYNSPFCADQASGSILANSYLPKNPDNDEPEKDNESLSSAAQQATKCFRESVSNSNSVLPTPSQIQTPECDQDMFNVPDRQTGKLALSELNPQRKWNFIEINITQKELMLHRRDRIQRLIYPLKTVLDDSIGCAVWFASRGMGVLANGERQKMCSKARVLLCGMAADEQFAGYSRHRGTFEKSGWKGLVMEMQEEIWRISVRNLGRDDRIISDHGKEARFPFLDETFTEFVSKIPVHHRADLTLPRGIGEKLLLRSAAVKLGLPKTACQPKRAIQFGSKIAKLDNSKEKGSDVCNRLV